MFDPMVWNVDPVLVHLDYVAGPYARGLLG